MHRPPPMLILIRHSISQPQPGVSAHHWQLTEAGRAKCLLIADRIRPYGVHAVYCSDEPKAITTAELVSQSLGLGLPAMDAGFRETQRETVSYYESKAEFEAHIERAMSAPDDLIFGEETFNAARRRFIDTLQRILNEHPQQTVAVVTHGTVLSLLLAPLLSRDTFELWKSIDMPAFFALSTPKLEPITICLSLDA